ncbi:MAG: transposase [Rhodobacteraceae bacterium]|nr:transposase [Paracoccaceae bacterium]
MQEHEAGAKCADLCRKHGMSECTFYAWQTKYSRMTVWEGRHWCAIDEVDGSRFRHRNVPCWVQ